MIQSTPPWPTTLNLASMGATRTALLDNWTWGLSLIALTIAIHATGVTFMVSVLHSFRVRLELESRNLDLPHLIAIVLAAFTAAALDFWTAG